MAADEYLDHELFNGSRVLSNCSSAHRGRRDIEGGLHHVEVIVFAQPERRAGQITIIDYSTSEQTTYTEALESAFVSKLAEPTEYECGTWSVNVVRRTPP